PVHPPDERYASSRIPGKTSPGKPARPRQPRRIWTSGEDAEGSEPSGNAHSNCDYPFTERRRPPKPNGAKIREIQVGRGHNRRVKPQEILSRTPNRPNPCASSHQL